MVLEGPQFEGSKLVTTWWDLVDHYLLAAMFAVSVASVGLQATQDRLICIPVVNCSDLARKASVVRGWSEQSRMSDICNRSQSFVVLTTMSDRRQYDYVDNECYEQMDGFSARYSLIFLVETLILLAISNFWLKCPDCVNALAHCERLISEFITDEFSAADEESPLLEPSEKEQREKLKKQREFTKKLRIFRACYSQKTTKFNLSSLTWQYRLRGVVGLIATIVALLVNTIYYFLSTGWTQCHLDGLASFSATHRFFQCTRSMGTYFHAGSTSFICLLSLHLIFVSWTILWSVTGERRGPTYELFYHFGGILAFEGDAAFLFHFILHSNYFRLARYAYEDKQQRKQKGEPGEGE
ncbi:volume-regulated anion channel subunit LRRC8A-like [Acropora palmata]|uniref:volume-regulated anion channel subunit LRRC8A-like n=1 Tax=Acropora palmata TaxID=6131 RepID=UPI003DA00C09